MKAALRAAASAAITGLLWIAAPSPAQTAGCSRIEIFSRADCPHCGHAREFLMELAATRPDLEIRISDVGLDPAARERLRELGARHGVRPIGVPAFLICDAFLVGFHDAATTGQAILAALGQPGSTLRWPSSCLGWARSTCGRSACRSSPPFWGS